MRAEDEVRTQVKGFSQHFVLFLGALELIYCAKSYELTVGMISIFN